MLFRSERDRFASHSEGLGRARCAAVWLLPVRHDHGGHRVDNDKPNPTDKDIDEAMTNICRCGTYNRVRTAIHTAAREMAAAKTGAKPKKIADLGKSILNIEHIDGGQA